MIAYLMMIGTIHYDRKLKNILQKIDWEDIYKNFKNDYDKSIKFVLGELKKNGDNVEFIRTETKKIYDFVCKLDIKTFGEFQKPQKSVGF
jgi:hypothetical protein